MAQPLGVDLAGVPAQIVTRAYHLWALQSPSAVARVASNWALHGVGGENAVRMGFLTDSSGRLAEFEHTDDTSLVRKLVRSREPLADARSLTWWSAGGPSSAVAMNDVEPHARACP